MFGIDMATKHIENTLSEAKVSRWLYILFNPIYLDLETLKFMCISRVFSLVLQPAFERSALFTKINQPSIIHQKSPPQWFVMGENNSLEFKPLITRPSIDGQKNSL